MQLTVVLDQSGKVIAAIRSVQGQNVRAGILPATADHALHHIDLPAELDAAPLHEVIKRVRSVKGEAPRIV
jgi:hypothetical protein